MKKKFAFCYVSLFICFVYFAAGTVPLKAEKKGEQYLEIELKRLEETYRLLDRFTEELWPGWNNYNEIEFKVRFPNLVYLLVNPRKHVPDGFKQLQGRTVHGKTIFINREKELPLEVKPPLIGGGKGGPTIRIRLNQIKIPPEKLKNEPVGYSEGQILLYIHEFFHSFQAKDKLPENEEGLETFEVNTGYATYSNIEGLALLGAYNEKDDVRALEYLKDYMVAREIKHRFMTPRAIRAEQLNCLSEGTASYSNIKMAMLIRDKKYKPGISKQEDPFFWGFENMDDYIDEHLTEDIRMTMQYTLDTIGKCYAFGAYQCFILDRFVPGWKKELSGFKKNLDEVTAKFLNLSPQQKKTIAARLKTKYPYDKLYAKHDAVVKERDNAVTMIKNRKGRKYIIDFRKTGELLRVKARGKRIAVKGAEMIFPHGIKKLQLGDIELTGRDTPMHRPWLRTLEWVDTEAKAGEKGYTISFKEKVEGTYKNVVIETKGFILEAPEIQIKENKEKDEVRIEILCKVAR